VPFEGGKAENHSLEIGSNAFIPGFEEQVVGMKQNDEKEIKVTFPEDYQAEDLKGKEVVFKVKVNEVKEKKTRALDEEFFEDLGLEGVNSKETLEVELKKSIKVNKEQEAENKYVDELLKELAKNTKVDVPEEVIESEINFMVQKFEEQMKMQGITLDLFYQMTKSNEQALREQMKEEARSHVMSRFIIDEIKAKENISISDKDLDKEIETISKKHNIDKEEFIKSYGGEENLKYEMEIKKVIEFLKENN
jgi:trigger factor